ncbi:tape measure protein [Janthinobacterium sp. UMAB-56]|uniref:tape measure protein n=1 Tax=Janthinobacterium sp. UMAB-56 TaxID=1365361 RepID=UPI00214AFF24|nr:tape measure protein [Janthinobacterium sp. UMAB-56]
MADEYAKFTAQLRLASTSVADYAASYDAVKRIAKTSQQDLASTGVLYARIANGTRELGTTQKQVAAITETVNLALRVSGATATESASAQLQLSQAFASGTLRGEEFNAVNEAAPRLMKALADGMGLPVGALKAMAGEGLITSNIMATVLPKALESLREESKNIQTISGAFTVLKNEMLEFFGIQAQANGTVAMITSAIRLLSENLGGLVIILKTLTAYQIGTWLATWVTKTYQQVSASIALRASTVAAAEAEMARTTILVAQSQAAITGLAVTHEATLVRLRSANADIVAAQAAIAAASAAGALSFALRTLRLATAELAVAETLRAAYLVESAALDRAKVAALAQLTAATAAQAAAQAALNGVTVAGITAAGVASKAIGFLGGPIGAIILLLGTAALAWEVFGKKAKAANEQAAESFEEAHTRIIKALDTQIDKQQNLLQLKNLGLTNQQAEKELPIIKQLEAATKRMGDLNARAGDFAGISNDDAIFKRIELNKQINELLEKQAKATKGAADVAIVTGNEAYKEWKKTYATREEQRAAEIADLKSRNLNAEQYAEILGRINLKYADKDAAKSLKQEENAYRTLVASIQEKLEANKLEALGFESMTDAQKMTVKLNAAILADKTKLNRADIERARVLIAQVAAEDAQLLSGKNVKKAIQELKEERDKDAASAFDEIEANKQAIATFGLTKAQIEALTLARMEDRLARRGPQDLDLDEAEVNHLTRMIGLQKEKAATAATLGALDAGTDVTKAKELLDILTAVDNAAKDAASGMAASFGAVGQAIGGMTTALTGFSRDQAAIAAQLAASMKDAGGDPDKIAKAQAMAAQQGAQAQVRSYGDMAKAAKGFFKENSTGYKLMETAEKAFRAYEMAMAIESMVKKLFTVSAVTTATVGGEAAKAAAVQAGVATQLTADTVKGTSAAAVAVATQAQGDPYSAWIRMAAMAAAMAALGFAVSGGGGSDTTAKDRQAATGTGSILGDSSAKSESIAHSLAIMEKNSGLGLAHTISMDQSLKQMVAGIGNLGNLLARSGITAAGAGATAGITTGSTPTLGKVGQGVLTGAATYGGAVLGGSIAGAMTMGTIGSSLTMMGAVAGPIGMAIGAAIGFVVSKLIKTSVSVKDSGITGAATSLGNVDALGFNAQAYADINVKKKAFGISYSSKDSTQTAALSNEMNDQFTMIITSMGDTIRSAADVLGLGGAAFNAHLNSFVVNLGKISLKDLSAEEQQKALETAFSKMGDDMAKFGVAGLAQYQAVGEGYLETLVRVTNDYIQVSDVLAVLGKSFNTTGLGAVALSESLITAAGGLEALTSGTSYFVENFLTEAERMAPITKSVNDAMGKLGISGVTTVDQFKALVLAQDLNTAAGQSMYAQLIAIAEPFKKAADYAAELAAATGDFAAVAKTASEIASEHRDLQQQLNELTKSETELLAIQRSSIAAVNRALFDQVQAAKAVVSAKDALGKAYDREAAAAQTALDKSKSWVATLNGLNASMALGSQSILTPEQKYAEARAQFEKTLAAANAGDTTAQSGLSAAEQAFLTASQVVNASDARYAADYARVVDANNEALKWASAQVDVQQASLDALKAQVSGLITINDSVLTVAQAIANLHAAMGTATGLGVKFDGSHAGGLANVPFDGYAAELHRGEVVVDAQAAAAMRRYFGGAPSQGGGNNDALVAEVKSLREELKGLRADQKAQTGATIQATVESNDKAAKTVVAGVDKSAKASAWAKQVEYSE